MSNNLQFDNKVRLDLAMEVLHAFGEIRFLALGESMLPSILPGDMVVVRKTTMGEIRAGEVVLYVRHECFFAHRVICVDGGLNLITRGDALVQSDLPVSEDELLGRVITVIRGLKTIHLTRDPGVKIRFLRWVFVRSDLATRFLIRTYRFYGRSSQKLNNTRTNLTDEILECS